MASIDCGAVINTQFGPTARACIHEVPRGSVTSQDESGQIVVRLDGGVVATIEPCLCPSVTGVQVIPEGASPTAYLPAQCPIAASDYDRRCQTVADCVLVATANLCANDCGSSCPSSTIARSALTQYTTDRDNTRPYGPFDRLCGCPTFGNPQCIDGVCAIALPGSLPLDAGNAAVRDASADGG